MNLKADQPVTTTLSVRAEPVQQRSAERITSLLDAAAELIDQGGIDGLTTSDVATRSGSSVGVVYRYFPNIQSLLKALAGRNMDKFQARVRDIAADESLDLYRSIDAVIDAYIDLEHTEPGFRALRFGHIIEDRFLTRTANEDGGLARVLTELFGGKFGIEATPELMFDLQVLIEVADALLRRAFRFDPAGDERFIARLRQIVADQLRPYAA